MNEALIATRVAHAGFEEHQFAGFGVFGELLGKTSMAGLVALAVAGRRLDAEACAVLDDCAAAVTMADPRIWPLKVARLVASYGGELEGVAAGLLCCDTAFLGPRVSAEAAGVLMAIAAALGERADDDAAVLEEANRLIETRGRLGGFGVPFRPVDERLVALRARLAARGGWLERRYSRLAMRLQAVLRRARGLEANIAMGVTPVLLDMGFTLPEVTSLTVALLQHTILANAVEGARQAHPMLQRLPDEAVRYVGQAPRSSPRAALAPS